jgi:hypothetical protein
MILFICTGFMASILWLDVKFDWLAVPYRGKPGILPEEVLAPMTYFYRYITGKPFAIATAILLILITLILEIVQGSVSAWVAWTSLILFGTAAVRAAIQVIPTARRFGMRTDTLEEQTRVAHALLEMHMFSLVAILIMGMLHLFALVAPMMTKLMMVSFACIGFIIGIGWVNLKFDLLAVPYRGKVEVLPEEILAPIAYFHRYLRSALQLGTAVMIVLVALIVQLVQGSAVGWVAWVSLVVFVVGMSIPIVLIRYGRQLGARVDSLEKQTRLAHQLFPGHLFALIIILLVGAFQLYATSGL